MDDSYQWIPKYDQHIDWSATIETGSVYDMLRNSERDYGNRPCLEFKGTHYSYTELGELVRRFAGGLHERGVTKGTKVGLFMPNCPQFVIAYYAIMKLGAIVVNYNPLYSASELKHQLHDSDTEVMVTLNLHMLYDKVQPLIGTGMLRHVIVGDLCRVLPMLKSAIYQLISFRATTTIPDNDQHTMFDALLTTAEHTTDIVIDPAQDVAVLQYTGGTTGVPKGVMLTHANLTANCNMCKAWFYDAELGQERMMAVLPFFHVFAMTVIMNYGIASGYELIMHPRFKVKPLLADINEKKPTLMPAVPTMFSAMMAHASFKRYDMSSLKVCLSGGAGLPLEVKHRFESASGCTVIEGYGLSESSPVVSCNPIYGENKAGSIGQPFPQTILEVVDQDDEVTLLPQGETGEICIRGPQVMKGYWNNPAETDHVLKQGRLYTGDIGYMDEDGYFFIVDRKKEMIISGGYNIYPRHIEEVLYEHEAVQECAVIGMDHPIRGQVPKAFIVLKKHAAIDEEDMLVYLRKNLSAYAVPRAIIFREALPKSIIGKILKKELS